jgi:hypothetical protein
MNDKHDEWWISYSKRKASVALEKAQDIISQAERAFKYQGLLNTRNSEALFRSSLRYLREASLWQPEKEYIKIYLHEIGKRIHDLFGCEIEFDRGAYQISCPVTLSHSKYGFSMGGSATIICSICGDDMLDCPHIKGRVYNGIVAKRQYDKCNVCGEGTCEHTEGEIYDGARAFGVITEVELDHIALVKNPANPLTVVTRYSLNKADILERLPEHERHLAEKGLFQYGDTLHCHHCVACHGSSTEE